MAAARTRMLPNILITGTPGTGKTTHAMQLYEQLSQSSSQATDEAGEGNGWEYVNVGDFVKERSCHSGWNDEWQCFDVDDDKLLDELEIVQAAGGKILDWHTCDIFPERWIDLVVVLRCNHELLWSRLEKRAYSVEKIQENNTAEIMQTVLEDARSSYAEEIVVELTSESADEVEANVARIAGWVQAWVANQADEE